MRFWKPADITDDGSGGGLIPSMISRMGLRFDVERGMEGGFGCNSSCSPLFPIIVLSARAMMNIFFDLVSSKRSSSRS